MGPTIHHDRSIGKFDSVASCVGKKNRVLVLKMARRGPQTVLVLFEGQRLIASACSNMQGV